MMREIATLKIQERKAAEFETIANHLAGKVNAYQEGLRYYLRTRT